jgi:hypothetical protein
MASSSPDPLIGRGSHHLSILFQRPFLETGRDKRIAEGTGANDEPDDKTIDYHPDYKPENIDHVSSC